VGSYHGGGTKVDTGLVEPRPAGYPKDSPVRGMTPLGSVYLDVGRSRSSPVYPGIPPCLEVPKGSLGYIGIPRGLAVCLAVSVYSGVFPAPGYLDAPRVHRDIPRDPRGYTD
jgi:hypothetical protein